MVLLSRATSLARESKEERFRYAQLVENSQSTNYHTRTYALEQLALYRYKRPTETVAEKFVDKMLGRASDLMLHMTEVKKPTWQGLAILLSAIVAVLVLGYALPALSVAPAVWLLALVGSYLGIIPMVVVGMVVLIEVIFLTLNAFPTHFDRSVIAADGYNEESSAKHELMFRAGSENWSTSQKLWSVILSALTFSFAMTVFLPVASTIVMIGISAVMMILYLKTEKSYGATFATIKVAKIGGVIRRYGYLYFLAAILPVFFVSNYATEFLDSIRL